MPRVPVRSVSPFLSKLGFGPQLRRRGDGSQYFDYAVGAIVGVITGGYMFGEPLREHFEELREEREQSQRQQPNPNIAPTTTTTATTTTTTATTAAKPP
eukprot:CAMPEP_0182482040 /NCGR_PEP_ID=MMETSP1319-20130603/38421_1 /TAXON_ID=172717 /ORGANISM="Bolidomonas pacifica, Strain RCC208" /LENGTH=98 /DNA_ID=CAMNT_0024683715 /DNA_START=177 /DNA_END=469 /DNA_ORIENTATION=-